MELTINTLNDEFFFNEGMFRIGYDGCLMTDDRFKNMCDILFSKCEKLTQKERIIRILKPQEIIDYFKTEVIFKRTTYRKIKNNNSIIEAAPILNKYVSKRVDGKNKARTKPNKPRTKPNTPRVKREGKTGT